VVICPKPITIRRTKAPNSDRLAIVPVDSIASIENIVINIDEPVTIRLLAFHTIGKFYCSDYKIEPAEKRLCLDIESKYIHLSKEGYPAEKSEFLLAFLPRSKTAGELCHLTKELCDIIEWLEIKQNVNCIVFRYGPPVHRNDDSIYWQKQFETIINETRRDYLIGQITGRIRHVREDDYKYITIHSANLFESINIS
jgi:hypothetical protein